MPIFEYLCGTCNRIYSFLTLRPRQTSDPTCPRCGRTGLTRVPSSFAVAASGKSKNEEPRTAASQTEGGPDAAAMSRVEAEAMQMAESLSEKDAEDPRIMARMMRRLAEASGEKVTPAMSEMFRRMEAGEDPDTLEEELGPQLESEMGDGGDGGEGGGLPTRDDGLYSM